MRLAIFVDQVFWRDGDLVSTDEPYALFLASFAEVCEQIVLIGRAAPERGRAPYTLDHPGIGLFPLPYYPSLYQLWRSDPRIYARIASAIRREAHRWDAFLLCGPHPIGQLIARQCLRADVPVALVVRQNLVEQMGAYRGPKRLATVSAARILDWDFNRLARGRTVFTVGDELTRAYGKLTSRVHAHTACLVDEEQFRRFSEMRTGSDPSRLLCVGRLAPEKGQEYLLQALSILTSRGVEVHLDLVGTGPLEQHLRGRVAALGLTAQVAFHGYVPYGPALFALYRKAGVLVLPSLTEGLPQVIGESLSAGLPTVATRVGGIPAFLTDGETALLVRPRDPAALAAAIERIVRDDRLSETLRRNGRALMHQNTLEANRARIMEAIRNELLATAA